MTFLRKRKIVNYSDIKRICKKKKTDSEMVNNILIEHGLEDVDEANNSGPLNLFVENDYENHENKDENNGNDENDSRLSKRTQYP